MHTSMIGISTLTLNVIFFPLLPQESIEAAAAATAAAAAATAAAAGGGGGKRHIPRYL